MLSAVWEKRNKRERKKKEIGIKNPILSSQNTEYIIQIEADTYIASQSESF